MVDIVSDVWRSHVKGSFGCNVPCVSADVQPPLRISANLIPTAPRAEENHAIVYKHL